MTRWGVGVGPTWAWLNPGADSRFRVEDAMLHRTGFGLAVVHTNQQWSGTTARSFGGGQTCPALISEPLMPVPLSCLAAFFVTKLPLRAYARLIPGLFCCGWESV